MGEAQGRGLPSLPPSLMRLKQIMSGSSSAFALHAKRSRGSALALKSIHVEKNATRLREMIAMVGGIVGELGRDRMR